MSIALRGYVWGFFNSETLKSFIKEGEKHFKRRKFFGTNCRGSKFTICILTFKGDDALVFRGKILWFARKLFSLLTIKNHRSWIIAEKKQRWANFSSLCENDDIEMYICLQSNVVKMSTSGLNRVHDYFSALPGFHL